MRTNRAQTEPLAALVAVVAIAVGIGIYGVYIADVLPGESDDAVEEPTIERVWDEISATGVYPAADSPEQSISESALPRGKTVYVQITTANESARQITVGEAIYHEGATGTSPGPNDPPEHGRAVTRPIPVRLAPGNVTGGTLRVVVW